MKVASVIGARPQFIKAAMVSRALREIPGMKEVVVHTGQHYDENMSGVFFEELEVPVPDYHLGIGSGSHGAQTGRMLEALERVLLKEKPEWVLVLGDTNSTLAGALAAAKIHMPVAHVEAGLRSFNRRMPEEINRVLTDHLSNRLFVPSEVALRNLRAEGIHQDRIRPVGDVMYDASLFYGRKAEPRSRVLDRLKLTPRGYVLATIHRAENTDDPARLRALVEGLGIVGKEIPVVFPVHPRARAAMGRGGLLDAVSSQVYLIDPVGYLDMLVLEKRARLIATDSGGVQKEAFFYEIPCVTLREETEWTELVELGWNHLVPPDSSERVAGAIMNLLDTRGASGRPYGAGKAAYLIAESLRGEPELHSK